MAVSLFHADVIGGFTDPDVAGATPACVLAYVSGDASQAIIRGGDADRRPSIRIPPSYVVGGATAYWAALELDDFDRIVVRTDTTNTGNGRSAGPELTDTAESTIGIAVRAPDGNIISFLLSVLNDPTEPYIRSINNQSGSNPAFSSAPISTFTGDEWLACRNGLNAAAGGQVVIVDTADPNVDFANLEFVSLTGVSQEGDRNRGCARWSPARSTWRCTRTSRPRQTRSPADPTRPSRCKTPSGTSASRTT